MASNFNSVEMTPVLLKTADVTNKPSRFIATSSVAAAEMSMGMTALGEIFFEDLNRETREYW